MVRYIARVITDAGIFELESCVTPEYAETVARNMAISTGLPTDVATVGLPGRVVAAETGAEHTSAAAELSAAQSARDAYLSQNSGA